MNNSRKVIFTIGYEGKLIDEFISILKRNKISRIIDIRRVPYSRNRDFRKDNIISILKQKKIDYLHYRSVAPSDNLRQKYKVNGSFSDFSAEYNKEMLSNPSILGDFINILKERDCLLCYEKRFYNCHRSLLVNLIKDYYLIVHL